MVKSVIAVKCQNDLPANNIIAVLIKIEKSFADYFVRISQIKMIICIFVWNSLNSDSYDFVRVFINLDLIRIEPVNLEKIPNNIKLRLNNFER